jgi:hypothetical protein
VLVLVLVIVIGQRAKVALQAGNLRSPGNCESEF